MIIGIDHQTAAINQWGVDLRLARVIAERNQERLISRG